MRKFTTLLASIALCAMAASPAFAAPCKDAKGKFIKCPPAKPAKPVKCKNASGKFAKCGTPARSQFTKESPQSLMAAGRIASSGRRSSGG